jgi:2-polyprenyl-3-methyl-5-hydroxy-6-metoxy-1,4-benzoquinol methylase
MSEFDQYSGSYQELLNASVSVTGETADYFAAYKARFIAERTAPKANCTILDYGCGVGLVCSQLKKYLPTARIDGYDVSETSLERIDPALRAQGIFASCTGDLSGAYDIVILANVLHHIEPKNRQSTISQAAGLLGQGGKLVIFEHNPANPLTRRAVERCPFDEKAILLPPRETVSYLDQKGFLEVRLNYIVFFPHSLRWLRALESLLTWCPFGAKYAAIGSGA